MTNMCQFAWDFLSFSTRSPVSRKPHQSQVKQNQEAGNKLQEQSQTPVCRRDTEETQNNHPTRAIQTKSPVVRTRTEESNWAQKEVRLCPFKAEICSTHKKFP